MVPRFTIRFVVFAALGFVSSALTAQEQSVGAELVHAAALEVASPEAPRLVELPQRRDYAVAHATFEAPVEESEVTSKPTDDAKKPAASDLAPLPLSPKRSNARKSGEATKASATTQSLTTVGGSLVIVLGLFFALAMITRRGVAKPVAKLPSEVIEVLGRAPLTKGQEMQLVRIGSKLLLINITPHGSETLTEFADADEVDRLAAVCRREHPAGVTAVFKQMLAQVEREPAVGFVGRPSGSSGGSYRA